MQLFQRVIKSAVFGFNILLIFLIVFQDRIVFPSWLQSFGRLHPLLLHLPIGTLVIALLVLLFRNEFKGEAFTRINMLVLSFAAITSVLSAIMGFALSKEGGYDESVLRYHLISGTAVSLLTWLLLIIDSQNQKLYRPLLLVSFVALIAAGHFGATITHGENFVLAPMMGKGEEQIVITDSTSLYHAAIEPVFREKCFSCHNEQKKKGNLLMTSVAAINKGGKHGVIWKAGDPKSSSIIERINLPDENDEHMPPVGKTPLTDKEKKLLYRWILAGADTKKAWTRFDAKDTLTLLANEFIQNGRNIDEPAYSFPFASKDKIKELNSPYRTVTQASIESPALAAEFFVSQAFKINSLEELKSVREQLVSLTLAGMPVGDTEGKMISEFTNLEKLDLNKTKITGAILNSLTGLKKLKSLALVGTEVDFKSLSQIATLPDLKEVFIWNAKIDKGQLAELESKFPSIRWNAGYPTTETLKLTPPLLVNDSLLIKEGQRIQLKHNLAGTIIRYTLDGTTPDSVTGLVYKEPISIDGFTKLKAIACRDEWLSSAVSEFTFFKSGRKPTSAELSTKADVKYKGEGINTLVDNKKSTFADFREPYWLGFRERPMEALFYFKDAKPIKKVTLGFAKSYYSYVVAPESVELWGGNDKSGLKLIERKVIPTPTQKEAGYCEDAVVFQLGEKSFNYYKVIARPVAKLPEFISKKKERGWVFVDEVIFN